MQGLFTALFIAGVATWVIRAVRRSERNWACPKCGTRAWLEMRKVDAPPQRCRKCGRVFDASDMQQEPHDDNRHKGPQVVGYACAVCGERIVWDHEAVPCEACGKPVHFACLPHAHDAGKTPYRD